MSAMKKLLALMMLLCLALFVVACGPKADDQPATTGGADAQSPEGGDAKATEGDTAAADEDEGQLEMLPDPSDAAPKLPTASEDTDVAAPDPLKPTE
jgi:hypothetical protein